MTGYSTPDGPATLHPDNCHCPACVDVEIVKEDSESITRCNWIEARRESAMTQAQRLADDKEQKYADYLEFIADQYEDVLDWNWSLGQID